VLPSTVLSGLRGRATKGHGLRGRWGRRRPPDSIGEGLERDCREVELVARAGETSQSHAFEAMVDLQVGKAHRDFLALIARLLELGGTL
jgi:hypothetical protein